MRLYGDEHRQNPEEALGLRDRVAESESPSQEMRAERPASGSLSHERTGRACSRLSRRIRRIEWPAAHDGYVTGTIAVQTTEHAS